MSRPRRTPPAEAAQPAAPRPRQLPCDRTTPAAALAAAKIMLLDFGASATIRALQIAMAELEPVADVADGVRVKQMQRNATEKERPQ